jgi:hypothetical protein
MKGVQLSASTYCQANARNATMTVTLIATISALTQADWVMPR